MQQGEFTLKDIAADIAMSLKTVIERAKEIGFSERQKLNAEQAQTLSTYIIHGIKPDDDKDAGKKETQKKVEKPKRVGKKKAENTDEKKEPTKKEEKKAEKIEIDEIVMLETKEAVIATEIKKPERKGFQIIKGAQESKPKESEKQESIKEEIKEVIKEEPQKEEQKEEVIEKKEESKEQVVTHQKLSDMLIPQGIEPSQIKKPKISAIRVISKNDSSPKSTESNTKNNAVMLLDSLKSVERKDKKKKKEKAPSQKQQKGGSHVIAMERGMGSSGYDDDFEEVMMIDIYEDMKDEVQVDDERVEKSRVNDKVKINRYSPWVKEGSIARTSKGRGKKNRSNRNRGSEAVTSLVLPEEIRVYEFAEKANLELGNVLGKLFLLGVKMLKNDFLDKDTIEILANEYNIEVTIQQNAQLIDYDEEIDESELVERPPVVTIMGHVDHGKTSLLDYIRNSRIASSEAGGITQHIGAYMVEKNGKWISFIDTPGHEAFAQMRSRGAQVTDIAIIVIAADDGVKQQSIEALNHAKSAGVQIIIAMNKMDKEGANPDKLKAECAELGFTPMDWGGEYEFIPISAKTGDGVDVLLETILLQAEILELRASESARVKAIVLEGSQQVGKGSVATIIVQQGILEVGQSIVADTAYGKVRTLKDDTGRSIKSLKPSGVAQITGLSEVPLAGALLQVVENDSIAREMANKRAAYLRQKQLSKSTKVTFDELSNMVAKGQIKSVPVILRADTQGSLEAIKGSLEGLNNQEVEINVISFGIGGITQSDLDLANASSNCVVLGFNVRPTSEIKNLAKDLGVTIKSYSIIYDLLDDMKALLSGMMSPVIEEEIVGFVSVRETFSVAKLGVIAGCVVVDGKVERNLSVRVLRNGVVLWSGKIASLKRFKDDVKEVSKGYECGIMLDGFNDIAVQDEFEIFREVEKQREV